MSSDDKSRQAYILSKNSNLCHIGGYLLTLCVTVPVA
jgi:hypothetical protein